MKKVELYTDGSCLGNPGYGGWGAVLRYGNTLKTVSGHVKETTTNNRMELLAIIKGLTYLKEPCKVTVYSDSNYAINLIENLRGVNECSKTYKNIDLIRFLLPLLNKHDILFKCIKGHAGIELNELADSLAKTKAEYIKQKLGGNDNGKRTNECI